jgi:hypothetical protein
MAGLSPGLSDQSDLRLLQLLREPGKRLRRNAVTELHVLLQMIQHLGSRVGPELGWVFSQTSGEADQPPRPTGRRTRRSRATRARSSTSTC